MSKLWSKGSETAGDTTRRVEAFTAGADRAFDNQLAAFDVEGSLAHVRMLAAVGILTKEDEALLVPALERLHTLALEGRLRVEDDVEDIHSQVELMLTRELGDVGKKIHAARSRNDQVLVDLKLFLRNELRLLTQAVAELTTVLLDLSERYADVLLPGYTHYQVAMPSSFGLWYGAYAESLLEDLWQMEAAYKLVNKNPLGSAAGYGSSFPIDREMTTRLLGFDNLHWNVVNAQMSRGKTEKAVATAAAAVSATLGRLAMDMTQYLSQNFDFISYPPELTTGSSIMPHKKNPDVFELIRARCNRCQALPNEIALVTTNLASGYHRDFQILKEHLFPALEELRDCLRMAAWVLPQGEPRRDIVQRDTYRYLFSVEEVNRRVNEGMSFREAYRAVGQAIEAGTYSATQTVAHTHAGSIGNLGTEHLRQQLAERTAVLGVVV